MATIDLSKAIIKKVDGSELEYDLSKELAEAIFQNTQSIPEHNFSLELYKNPVVELTEENRNTILNYGQKHFKAFAWLAILNLINNA